jgi:AraC family transcriptional regulator
MSEEQRIGAFYGAPLADGKVGRFHVAERLYEPFQRIPRHTHETPYVCVVVEGRYEERSGRGTATCAASTLLLHPAGAVHSDRFGAGATRLLMLEMDGSWLEALDAPPLREPGIFASGPVAAFGTRLRREAAWRDDVSPLALEGLVLELLASVHRERTPAGTRVPAWLRRTRERLESSFRRPPSIAQLAAEAGVHPAHLTRSFRRHFLRSIGAFTREARVNRAKELLPKLPLADVALACGFADQSHFTRTFRRLQGVTPAEFRKAAKR